MGPTSYTAPLLPGTRFQLDFGSIHASSVDFGITPGHLFVTSFDGNNTYIRIVCANTRHMLIFCQASKSTILSLNGS
jgi:hypothetical protein